MRKIIHVDMDAFYASVEIRDNPDLKNKAVIISGPPDSRSVVCTCNYIARKYGIHSALPASRAYKLCPQAVFIYPNMKKYKDVSQQIHGVFNRFSSLVEPISLDEAYLDVSDSSFSRSATLIAKEIKKQINNITGLSVSAGVSYNKLLAKIASDWEKPDGLTVIEPKKAISFLKKLPVSKIYGIGKKTNAKMIELGIKTGEDLLTWPLYQLLEQFGKAGNFYYNAIRGIDERPVFTGGKRKSLGKEITLDKDLTSIDEIAPYISELLDQILLGCSKNSISPGQLNLKLKYSDFELKTRRVKGFVDKAAKEELMNNVMETLLHLKDPQRSIRLIGLSFSRLNFIGEPDPNGQLDLMF